MALGRLGTAAAAAGIALLTWALPARADDGGGGGDPTRDMIQEEIKAYMKAEKEKKSKEDAEKGVMKVNWKDGLSFESADKKYKFKFTGRLQIDGWFFDDGDEDLTAEVGEFDSGVGFRRARLGVNMTICKYGVGVFEYDFARGGTSQGFADAYMGLKGADECVCGLPDFKVGHFKEPFSLEELTSSRNITFMERSQSVGIFAPARNTGILAENTAWSDRLLWQLGAFHAVTNNFGDGIFNEDPTVSDFSDDDDGWSVTGRLSVVPWRDCNCDCRLLHLGAAASWRQDLRSVRFRARPETFIGPRVVDTGAFDADEVLLLGAEAALVYDRLSVQSEFVYCDVSSDTADDPGFYGWYAYASYFLTGECRNYKLGSGHFDAVKPCRPFWCGECAGAGAWEVAARFSYLDLDDGLAPGGTTWDITLGLNWYLNTNMKVMFNFVHSDTENAAGNDDADGAVDAFGVRFQIWW
jgi:phosphate-selective porin OprO/OprP